MFKTITSKFDSKCRRCGEAVYAGEKVRWAKGRGVYHFSNVCGELLDSLEREMTHKEQFGRCEDAPCCGCC